MTRLRRYSTARFITLTNIKAGRFALHFFNWMVHAVRMDYQKILTTKVNPTIQDYELQAIMTANTPAGMSWAPMAYDNPDSPNKGLAKAMESFVAVGQKMWRRTDGAILWLRSNLIVRLELPGGARTRSAAESRERTDCKMCSLYLTNPLFP